MSEGASAQGDFTISWAALGIPGRGDETGCARRFPNPLKSPLWSNPANRPGSQPMPE